MTINVHDVGDPVRIAATFLDLSGDPVDPATVELHVMDPSGNIGIFHYEASPTDIVRVSTGSFYKDVEADEPGDWYYRWVSTGPGQGAEPGQFVVAPTPFP